MLVRIAILATFVIAIHRGRSRYTSHDSAPTADSNGQSSIYDYYDMTSNNDDQESQQLLKDIERLKMGNEKLQIDLERCLDSALSALSKSGRYQRIPVFFW